MRAMGLDARVVCGFWLHKNVGKTYSKEYRLVRRSSPRS